MRKFFSKVKPDPADPAVSTLGNLANFYSLLVFLIAIPFILIVALVWLTGILGFSAWIFAAFAVLCLFIVWRIYRRWGQFKSKVAAQSDDFQDLMRQANQAGKDVEISLMNGVLTLRYKGQDRLAHALPAGASQPLALEAPYAAEETEASCRRRGCGKNWRSSSGSGTRASSAPRNSTASRPACCSGCRPSPLPDPPV
jgi:membrane protein implicated in regulation of membrane protease activity